MYNTSASDLIHVPVIDATDPVKLQVKSLQQPDPSKPEHSPPVIRLSVKKRGMRSETYLHERSLGLPVLERDSSSMAV